MTVATFEGSWKIDAARSKVWDYARGCYADDEVGDERIRIRLDGDVQDYEVLLGDDPTIRMGYTSRYDDPTWVNYTVREVISATGDDSDAAVNGFVVRIKSRVKSYKVGEIYGRVRSVYVDERTHYRVSKAADGAAEYIMMRRLAGDGQSYVASVLAVDGIINRVRTFVRVAA